MSIARGTSPAGPFVGCPANPVLSARSTDRPIQNTGHADLVQAPDGSWHLVLLGMRTKGMTRSFSPLGRETFATSLEWVDEWPVVRSVTLTEGLNAPTFFDEFSGDALGPEWIAVRRFPHDIGRVAGGRLRLFGEARTMDDEQPTFIGRRQRRLDARVSVSVDRGGGGGDSGRDEGDEVRDGVGGLTVRYDEEHHYDLEINGDEIVSRACIPTISTEFRAPLPSGTVVLFAEMTPPPPSQYSGMTCDIIQLGYDSHDGTRTVVGAFDGRSLSAETACSFTGRVIGLYCVPGEMWFGRYCEERLA